MTDKHHIAQEIKAEALRLGFAACGVAKAQAVNPAEKALFTEWIARDYHADMAYMAHNEDKRTDPTLLVEGCKSVICLALNYYPRQRLGEDQLQFAYYAYGKDYHDVMKQKLGELLHFIVSNYPAADGKPATGRAFCDTAPLLERYWARQAGLGWIGKNTQLIMPRAGSYFVLGELLVDIEMECDSPAQEQCGACTRCLSACPAGALEAPFVLNSGKCLSYLTIENKGTIADEKALCIGNRIYGCDECQKACPHNSFARPNETEELQPSPHFLQMTTHRWQQLSIEQYRSLFKGSAVKRAKYEGLLRNIRMAAPLKTYTPPTD